MVSTPSVEISRRQFLVAAGLTATTACLAPGALAAQSEDVLVPTAFKVATTAKITVQYLWRNELLEDHIRNHLPRNSKSAEEAAEDVTEIVRTYLK